MGAELVVDQRIFEQDVLAPLAALAEGEDYAVDTEFHRERTYWPRLALIQLAWHDRIVIVDPLAVEVAGLAEVLSGPATLLAHAADQDLEVLAHACDAEPSRLFDTQLAAGFLGMSSPSLTSLAENLLGIRLPKGDRLTDWSKRPLTESQLSYAASDVAHLHDLADVIRGRLTEAGRLAWAEQECANLLARARGPQDPDTAWWRLREGRTLRGQARGVAQAVVAWRERRAMELDIPPRFVLPDLAVLSIAHRPPSDAAGLDGVRGVEGRHLKGRAVKDLLAAIETGQQLDGTALRLPVVEDVDRDQRPAVALAAAWIAQLGRELAIDPALLATRADIVALLRGDEGARAAMGWRADVVGDPVRRLARGDAALAFDGRGGLVLEERSRRPITAF